MVARQVICGLRIDEFHWSDHDSCVSSTRVWPKKTQAVAQCDAGQGGIWLQAFLANLGFERHGVIGSLAYGEPFVEVEHLATIALNL